MAAMGPLQLYNIPSGISSQGAEGAPATRGGEGGAEGLGFGEDRGEVVGGGGKEDEAVGGGDGLCKD